MTRANVYIRLCLISLAVTLPGVRPAYGVVPVPGTGRLITQVGDDFEDGNWRFLPNGPKSTRDIDGRDHKPQAGAANRRWYEGIKRGHPDLIQRVATPAGGLIGSKASLLLRSLHTGIPGRPSFTMQQDDFIADVRYRLGTAIHVTRSPNVIVRVFLPPVNTWENRSGPQFGFRAALETTLARPRPRVDLASTQQKREIYWPGMFIDFQSETDGHGDDYAYLRLRCDQNGNDFRANQITATGWWTFGISVTPDGMVHYYARPGVEPLTARDRITSHYPYGYRAEWFKTFFFNVCNGDDGRSWSTAWVIDDPMVYVVR
jgi:hypothetical protein